MFDESTNARLKQRGVLRGDPRTFQDMLLDWLATAHVSLDSPDNNKTLGDFVTTTLQLPPFYIETIKNICTGSSPGPKLMRHIAMRVPETVAIPRIMMNRGNVLVKQAKGHYIAELTDEEYTAGKEALLLDHLCKPLVMPPRYTNFVPSPFWIQLQHLIMQTLESKGLDEEMALANIANFVGLPIKALVGLRPLPSNKNLEETCDKIADAFAGSGMLTHEQWRQLAKEHFSQRIAAQEGVTFGELVHIMRSYDDCFRYDWSKRLSVHVQALRRWEKDERIPQTYTFNEIMTVARLTDATRQHITDRYLEFRLRIGRKIPFSNPQEEACTLGELLQACRNDLSALEGCIITQNEIGTRLAKNLNKTKPYTKKQIHKHEADDATLLGKDIVDGYAEVYKDVISREHLIDIRYALLQKESIETSSLGNFFGLAIQLMNIKPDGFSKALGTSSYHSLRTLVAKGYMDTVRIDAICEQFDNHNSALPENSCREIDTQKFRVMAEMATQTRLSKKFADKHLRDYNGRGNRMH